MYGADRHLFSVTPGLVPGIPPRLAQSSPDRNHRDKPGDDVRKRSCRLLLLIAIALAAIVILSTTAHADLKICNRMSYVVEAAIGIDDKGATATRGWFRIDPATCRTVAQGTLNVDRILLHARALPIYGASPIPQSGTDKLCVASDNFVIAAARDCRGKQTAASFTEVKPSVGDDGNAITYLAEGSEYDDEQARLAAIQRLLVIAGYDASPIDGVDGPKTQAALAAFLKAHNLGAEVVQAPDFFQRMVEAVQAPTGPGLTWCNDTRYRVMASIGTEDNKSVTTRGWYRIEPGKCLHPDVTGHPKQVFSFAEAVDNDGRTIKLDGKPLNWGGSTTLCSRENQFETNQQRDCDTRGFSTTGYAAVDIAADSGRTLRFGMP